MDSMVVNRLRIFIEQRVFGSLNRKLLKYALALQFVDDASTHVAPRGVDAVFKSTDDLELLNSPIFKYLSSILEQIGFLILAPHTSFLL